MKPVDVAISAAVALTLLIPVGIVGQILGWCWISPAC